jgi:OTU domain-containing protein 5
MDVVIEKGDNNCLFRAVAHQIYGDADKFHAQVRREACDWLATNEGRAHFEHLIVKHTGVFLGGDVDNVRRTFKQYISHMRQPGMWGGDVEIAAMEHFYRRNIRIRENGNWVNRGFTWENFNYPIRVERVGESHYNSLSDPSHPDRWGFGRARSDGMNANAKR